MSEFARAELHTKILDKPIHLILLLPSNKKSLTEKFLSVDKPDITNTSFACAKGVFVNDLTEEEIFEKYQEIISSKEKEKFVEMMFPVNRILSIQNLFYKKK